MSVGASRDVSRALGVSYGTSKDHLLMRGPCSLLTGLIAVQRYPAPCTPFQGSVVGAARAQLATVMTAKGPWVQDHLRGDIFSNLGMIL